MIFTIMGETRIRKIPQINIKEYQRCVFCAHMQSTPSGDTRDVWLKTTFSGAWLGRKVYSRNGCISQFTGNLDEIWNMI